MIQAKAKETESDGTINKKAHELVNAGQGEVSSNEKLTAQSTEARKLPDNEIHSETMRLEPLNDGATLSTPESKEGTKAPPNLKPVRGHLGCQDRLHKEGAVGQRWPQDSRLGRFQVCGCRFEGERENCAHLCGPPWD